MPKTRPSGRLVPLGLPSPTSGAQCLIYISKPLWTFIAYFFAVATSQSEAISFVALFRYSIREGNNHNLHQHRSLLRPWWCVNSLPPGLRIHRNSLDVISPLFFNTMATCSALHDCSSYDVADVVNVMNYYFVFRLCLVHFHELLSIFVSNYLSSLGHFRWVMYRE